MPRISVIIPAYNVEKYISECLDSIINQTEKDIEILCIDDGSTDNTLKLLEEYSQKDNRIKVLCQKNSGPAKARNYGLNEAKGEYVSFIDADDYLGNSDFYENLYSIATTNNADAVKGIYRDTKTGWTNHLINSKIDINKNYFFIEYLSAIFKREIIEQNNIRFPDLRDMEDPVFTFIFSTKSNKILTTNGSLLMKRARENAITNGAPSAKQIKQKIQGLELLIKYAENLIDEEFGYAVSFWFGYIWGDIRKNKNFSVVFKSYCKMRQIYLNLKYREAFEYNLKENAIEVYDLFCKPFISVILGMLFSIKNYNKYINITVLGLKIKINKNNIIMIFFRNLYYLCHHDLFMEMKKAQNLSTITELAAFKFAYCQDKIKLPIIKGNEETISELLNTNKSIIRYGDGEFKIISGQSLDFQEYNYHLAKSLENIFYNDEENLLIGTITEYYELPFGLRKEVWDYLHDYTQQNFLQKTQKYYNFNKIYYSSFITNVFAEYEHFDYESHYFKLKKIWNDKEIVIITGDKVFKNVKYNIFENAKSIDYVEAPTSNAYCNYEEIKSQILKINKGKILIFALGPCGKVLAYDMFKEGYRVLDLGHLIKDYNFYKISKDLSDKEFYNIRAGFYFKD